ncbi:ATP-binding protein [Actinomadura sp. CNU-125]|uniref:ATP-binding protein n=1 Tax=Actinomadura sp. CNU-125 TaxID=1904961 RepID=UPI0011774829
MHGRTTGERGQASVRGDDARPCACHEGTRTGQTSRAGRPFTSGARRPARRRARARLPAAARRLYGREPDLAALAAVLDAVPRRGPRLLSLEGAAGVGKTALLGGVRTDVRRRGWTVLPARAAFLETANDFGVLRQILAGLPAPPDGREPPALPAATADGAAALRRVRGRDRAPARGRRAHPRRDHAGRSAVVRPAVAALARLPRAPQRRPADRDRRGVLPRGDGRAAVPGRRADRAVRAAHARRAGARAAARLDRRRARRPAGRRVRRGVPPGDRRLAALLAALLPALAARSTPPVRASLPALQRVRAAARCPSASCRGSCAAARTRRPSRRPSRCSTRTPSWSSSPNWPGSNSTARHAPSTG